MEKKKKIIIMSLLGFLTVSFVIFYGVIPAIVPFISAGDVDYIYEGEYSGDFLVTGVLEGSIIIVDEGGTVKWKCEIPKFFPHDADILPNGNVLIADTNNDRVIEVDINNPTKIVWSWDARYISDVNWTKFGIECGWSETAISYIDDQDRPEKDWTHLNDVELINGSKFGRSYDTILIDLRNFDTVIEVNYSETKEIVWWYGEPGNFSLLCKQHNPDRYDNGNTVVCDSENNRFIEINTTTKEIVWELKLEFPNGKFRWARDCDDIGGDLRLITDSANARLLVYDMNSEQFIKEIRSPFFFNPYEADLLEDGRIIAGSIEYGCLIIIDYETGATLGIIGFPVLISGPYLLVLVILVYHLIMLFITIKNSNKKPKQKISSFHVYRRIIYVVSTVLSLIFFTYIIEFLWEFQIRAIAEFFLGT